MRVIEKTVYTFSELSQDAQNKVLENNRDFLVEGNWYNAVYEDFLQIAEMLGFTVSEKIISRRKQDGSPVYEPCVYFSGFWSQGDGASFEARYKYKKDWRKALQDYAPQDKELLEIGERLQALQKPFFYQAAMLIETRGNYCHANTMQSSSFYRLGTDDINNRSAEKDFLECARDLANWLYTQLEKEYDHLTSDETLREYFSESDYLEFYENGEAA